jgi:hypothetical protein
MKPFIQEPNKAMGGSTAQKSQSWSFQRKSIANAKRKSRRSRRRSDKLKLSQEM